MMPAQTAKETLTAHAAFRLYENAFENDALIQGEWHAERDGRQLACALGTLGPDIQDSSDCPATVMPRWLAQLVPAFFDKQRFDDAKAWGLEFYKALDRIGGNVPFSVIHDWHANTVCQLGIDAAAKRGRDTAPHVALQNLHKRALAGEKITADEWRPVLKNSYAYAAADAYAAAYADADAYAYAAAYADADAYADAYANAADAYADAYANAADAYADAYAAVYAWKILADGMVAALNRSQVSA